VYSLIFALAEAGNGSVQSLEEIQAELAEAWPAYSLGRQDVILHGGRRKLTPELRKRLLDVVKKFLRWLETKDFIDPVENPVSGLAVEDILPSLDGNRLGGKIDKVLR